MDSFTVDPWPAWDSDMRTSFSCSRQFLHFVLTKSRTRRAAQWREAARGQLYFTLNIGLNWRPKVGVHDLTPHDGADSFSFIREVQESPPTSSPAQLMYYLSELTRHWTSQHASKHNLLGFFHIFYGLRLKSLWAGGAAAGSSRAACLVKVSSRCLAAVSISEPSPAQPSPAHPSPWWGCYPLVVVIRTVDTLSVCCNSWLLLLLLAAPGEPSLAPWEMSLIAGACFPNEM